MKKRVFILILAAAALAGWLVYGEFFQGEKYDHDKFVCGNGRLEATEVNVASKLPGRIAEIWVDEGDLVRQGQKLARMKTSDLEADLAQAGAQRDKALTAEAKARASVEVKLSELEAAKAGLLQRESRLAGAKKRFDRSKILTAANASSKQEYDDNETNLLTAQADVAAARATVRQAEAAVNAAKADVVGAGADIKAMEADIERIQVDIDDSMLTAPRDGRIQYRIAQPGEVLSAGGKVLNLVDLTDVYMTFFLPEEVAGRVAIGSEVRLVLDAMPGVPVPAEVSYVASVAQFTPKTVETKSERQKLMFRVKAHIKPELLQKYIEFVKTGIPGVAWVKLDKNAEWPDFLQLRKKK